MKKILSLTLAVMLLVSAIPTAFAADQDYTLGTAVTVEGAGGEYIVTVPATLNAGEVGTVTAKGYWSKDEMLSVTAPETIEVTHTETNQKATVNVDFDGIKSMGDDLEEMSVSVNISIDHGNTKFGQWTGAIVYTVTLEEIPDLIHFTIDGKSYSAEEGMTWSTWVSSDYNDGTVSIFSGLYVKKDEKFVCKGEWREPKSREIVAGTAYIATNEYTN